MATSLAPQLGALHLGRVCWENICQVQDMVAQRLKRLPAMQETWVQSPGREDALEKEMATHSSILA